MTNIFSSLSAIQRDVLFIAYNRNSVTEGQIEDALQQYYEKQIDCFD